MNKKIIKITCNTIRFYQSGAYQVSEVENQNFIASMPSMCGKGSQSQLDFVFTGMGGDVTVTNPDQQTIKVA